MSVPRIKELLFRNDIGYLKDASKNNMLMVKRFYKIPLLLFPLEVFCIKVLRKFELAE